MGSKKACTPCVLWAPVSCPRGFLEAVLSPEDAAAIDTISLFLGSGALLSLPCTKLDPCKALESLESLTSEEFLYAAKSGKDVLDTNIAWELDGEQNQELCKKVMSLLKDWHVLSVLECVMTGKGPQDLQEILAANESKSPVDLNHRVYAWLGLASWLGRPETDRLACKLARGLFNHFNAIESSKLPPTLLHGSRDASPPRPPQTACYGPEFYKKTTSPSPSSSLSQQEIPRAPPTRKSRKSVTGSRKSASTISKGRGKVATKSNSKRTLLRSLPSISTCSRYQTRSKGLAEPSPH